MSDGLNELGAKAIIETSKEIGKEAYKDIAQPFTKSTGQLIKVIPDAINAVLLPLNQWVAERKYKLDETKKLLAIKLENIDTSKIVTPPSHIAVPALKAISYSMDSDELRNMYAALLASSMNSDKQYSVHPSFVEIIKQLSPFDARLLKIITETEINPLIDILAKAKPEGEIVLFENFYIPQDGEDDNIKNYATISIALCNLERLKIIDIKRGNYYTKSGAYDTLINSKFYERNNDHITVLNKKGGDYTLSYKKGFFNLTIFGQSFASTVFD